MEGFSYNSCTNSATARPGNNDVTYLYGKDINTSFISIFILLNYSLIVFFILRGWGHKFAAFPRI